MMLGRFLSRRGVLEEAGARARREHSAWLTAALREGGARWPRIPTRLVSEGGFARVLARRDGAARCERWWGAAIGRTEAMGPQRGDRFGR